MTLRTKKMKQAKKVKKLYRNISLRFKLLTTSIASAMKLENASTETNLSIRY